MIKLRGMRQAGHVALVEKSKDTYRPIVLGEEDVKHMMAIVKMFENEKVEEETVMQ